MRYISELLSGIGILIALYLILSQGAQANKLINTVLTGSTSAIKVLQGRG